MSIELKISQQKGIANEVLDKIHKKYPLAFVAGGAPRDWYMDKPANDIDVYIPSLDEAVKMKNTLVELKLLEDDQKSLQHTKKSLEDRGVDYNMAGIKDVFAIEELNTPIQLITVDLETPYEIVQKFAATISMFLWVNGRLIPTFEALYSIKSCIIGHQPAAVGYISKMKKRYPEFEFVGFEDFHQRVFKNLTDNQVMGIMKEVLL